MFTPNDNTQEYQQRRENFRQQARYIEEAFAHLATQQKSPTSTEADKDSVGIAFVGQTGAGKSTLINFLLGRRLILWDSDEHGERGDRIDDYLYLDNSEDPTLAAGMAENAESCTQYINQFPIPDVPVGEMRDKTCVIYDTPGFGDTDTNRQFANGLLLEEMIKQHNGLRIAVVLSSDQFNAQGEGKGESFKQLAKHLGTFLNLSQINKNIVFLINVQRDDKFKPKKMEQELKAICEVMKTELERTVEADKKFEIASGIGFCGFLRQCIVDNLVIITHPLKDDRAAILSQLAEVAPLGVEGLNFQTGERQTFKDDLTDYFIVPSLNELRRLSVLEAAVTGNMAYQERLATYLALISSDKFADTLAKDFTLEKEQLDKYRKQDEQLTEKLNKAEEALEALEPDAEISLADISGIDNFLLSGETSFLATSIAAGLPFLTALASTQMLVPVMMSFNPVGTFCIVFGLGAQIAIGLEKLPPLCFSRVTRKFKHILRTEITIKEKYKDDRHSYNYTLDSGPDISEDHQECTMVFKRERVSDNPKRLDTVVSIIGKKEHHPDFAPLILTLRNQIKDIKAEQESHTNQLNLTIGLVKLLETLNSMQKSGESAEAMKKVIDEAIENQSGDQQLSVEKRIEALRYYRVELSAIQKVLCHVSVPGITDEFEKAYSELLKNHPEFLVEDLLVELRKPMAVSAPSSTSPVLSGNSASGPGLFALGSTAAAEAKEEQPTMAPL